MVIADISQSNENRYATVRDIVEEMYDHMSNRGFGVAPADDDLILLGDVSQTVTNRIRGTTWQNVEESLEVDAMDSGTATDGQVATADGSGGIDWEDQSGGGGGSFDLHDDVTGYIGTGALSGNDRMVVSDESLAGDPNRYVEVDEVVQRLYALGLSEVMATATPANNDLVFIGDTSRGTGNRVRAIEMSDLLERLDVEDMGSGSATDGQVPTADGSGGIDWEAGGGSFNLHDEITTNIGNNLNLSDRMIISDESIVGDPNRYAEVRTILNELYYLANGRLLTDAIEDDDVIPIGDTSQLTSTDKMRGMQFDEFVSNLTVADMDSESATNGQVATADGSGGIAWEDPSGGGGGGGGTADDVEILATTALNANGPTPILLALDESLEDGQLVRVDLQSTTNNRAHGYGMFLADDLRGKVAQAAGTAPAVAQLDNAISLRVAGTQNSTLSGNASGSIHIWYVDDDNIWVNYTRAEPTQITIAALPLGVATAMQQASSGVTVVENEVITAPFPMTESPLADDWRGTQQQGIPLTGIPKDEIDRIEFGLRIDSRYVIPFVVTRAMLNRLTPTSDIIPTSPANSAIMQGVYWSGRPSAPNSSREHLILLPTYGYMDGRRLANRSGFFMTFDDDASGDNWIQAYVGANSGDEIDISYLTTYRFQTD